MTSTPNRLRTLAAALTLAAEMDVEVRVVWEPQDGDNKCVPPWDALFSSPPIRVEPRVPEHCTEWVEATLAASPEDLLDSPHWNMLNGRPTLCLSALWLQSKQRWPQDATWFFKCALRASPRMRHLVSRYQQRVKWTDSNWIGVSFWDQDRVSIIHDHNITSIDEAFHATADATARAMGSLGSLMGSPKLEVEVTKGTRFFLATDHAQAAAVLEGRFPPGKVVSLSKRVPSSVQHFARPGGPTGRLPDSQTSLLPQLTAMGGALMVDKIAEAARQRAAHQQRQQSGQGQEEPTAAATTTADASRGDSKVGGGTRKLLTGSSSARSAPASAASLPEAASALEVAAALASAQGVATEAAEAQAGNSGAAGAAAVGTTAGFTAEAIAAAAVGADVATAATPVTETAALGMGEAGTRAVGGAAGGDTAAGGGHLRQLLQEGPSSRLHGASTVASSLFKGPGRAVVRGMARLRIIDAGDAGASGGTIPLGELAGMRNSRRPSAGATAGATAGEAPAFVPQQCVEGAMEVMELLLLAECIVVVGPSYSSLAGVASLMGGDMFIGVDPYGAVGCGAVGVAC